MVNTGTAKEENQRTEEEKRIISSNMLHDSLSNRRGNNYYCKQKCDKNVGQKQQLTLIHERLLMKLILFFLLFGLSMGMAQTEGIVFQNLIYKNDQENVSEIQKLLHYQGASIYFSATDTVSVTIIVEYKSSLLHTSWAKAEFTFSSDESPYFAQGFSLRGIMGFGGSGDNIPSAQFVRFRVRFDSAGNDTQGNGLYSLYFYVK
jgi:hypothetical protein